MNNQDKATAWLDEQRSDKPKSGLSVEEAEKRLKPKVEDAGRSKAPTRFEL